MIYLPLVFIPLLTLGIFSYQINTASSINKTKKNVQDESRLITTRIDTILSNAESFANVSMLELNKEEKLKLKQKGDQLNSDSVHRTMEAPLCVAVKFYTAAFAYLLH